MQNPLSKKQFKNMSKEKLIIMAQHDNFDALEEIIQKEQKNAYAAFYYLNVKSEDIPDLTQEALFRMSKNIKKLKEPKNFNAWFNQIITNIFYDEIRKKYKKLPTISIEGNNENNNNNNIQVKEIIDNKKIPLETALVNELDDKITGAIHTLVEPFRLAIILRELQGLSYEDIAEITNTTIGTVKSRISRARNKLQEYLKPYLFQT